MPNPRGFLPKALCVLAAAGLAGALLAAPAQAVRTEQMTSSCAAPDPDVPKEQFRAMWIATVVNIDWPSRQGLPVADQKAEYTRWLDEAVARKFNAVIVQVRPTADAFWPSPYEPWSQWITGAQGQDPGYDPLAFFVAEAHKRNLEFHAWFNPYRVSMQTDPAQLVPTHPGRVHPEWILPYGGKLYYNPGIPAVRAFVEDAIMDAVKRYDIDGVHFDDYFYPYPVAGQVFADDATYAQYGAGFATKPDWRRNNIDLLMKELDQKIHAAKPWVKFGVSPFAIWRNKSTDPTGSDTQGGVQTYDDLGADTKKWVREGWLDYITPQIYWNIGFTVADYQKLVPWWSNVVAGTDVQLIIGQATYKAGTTTQVPGWGDPAEMSKHLFLNRTYPAVVGDIFFSAKDVRANRLGGMDVVVADHYSRPAFTPVAEQLGGAAPRQPALIAPRRSADGVELRWIDAQPPSKRATSFAIYRFEGKRDLSACDFQDASGLIAHVRSDGSATQEWVDTTAETGKFYTYAVSGLDRLSNESAPSHERVVGR